MLLEAWEGRYWQAADIIAAMLKSSLDEWIGADQARAPKALLKAAEDAMCQAAVKRVEQANEHFQARPKKERESALKLSETKRAYHYPNMFKLLADHKWEVQCPACKGRAFLAGMEYGEEILDTSPGEESWEEEVEKQYGAEEFQCPTCDLHLDSRQEINAAGIDPDHTEVETREREYEPDYGNC